jgi:DNA-binding NtrC family response regulator
MVTSIEKALSVLIVEPDAFISRRLKEACGALARVTTCPDFPSGRERLMVDQPNFLVSNLRLNEYNGLHLLFLTHAEERATRCIIHTSRPDFSLVGEAQKLGAVFEWTERLPYALHQYLQNPWPENDRRSALRIDRRRIFRGGRRAPDVAQLFSPIA